MHLCFSLSPHSLTPPSLILSLAPSCSIPEHIFLIFSLYSFTKVLSPFLLPNSSYLCTLSFLYAILSHLLGQLLRCMILVQSLSPSLFLSFSLSFSSHSSPLALDVTISSDLLLFHLQAPRWSVLLPWQDNVSRAKAITVCKNKQG